MMNQVVLIGKVTHVDYQRIAIKVDDDTVISFNIPDAMKENVASVVKYGSVVGVKGKLISCGINLEVEIAKFTLLKD